MKTFLVFAILTTSTIASASDCTESLRELKAVIAATQMELVTSGGGFLSREVLPMSGYDMYAVRFSYSGVQRSWRVHVDQASCEVTSIAR